MKKTLLETAIGNHKVLGYVDGQPSPLNKNSNLYKKIVELGYTPADLGSKIAIAIGAHRRMGTEGFYMAIVEISEAEAKEEIAWFWRKANGWR